MEPPSATVAAGQLLQHVSRATYRGTKLHFGRDATNRYDSPDRSYGVLYLGFDLSTALMESVFHQHRWHRSAKRTISIAEVNSRMVRAVGVLDADHADWPQFVVDHKIGIVPTARKRARPKSP